MAKVNITNKLAEDLEKAVAMLAEYSKGAKGNVRKEVVDVKLSLSEILVRLDNRKEKEY